MPAQHCTRQSPGLNRKEGQGDLPRYPSSLIHQFPLQISLYSSSGVDNMLLVATQRGPTLSCPWPQAGFVVSFLIHLMKRTHSCHLRYSRTYHVRILPNTLRPTTEPCSHKLTSQLPAWSSTSRSVEELTSDYSRLRVHYHTLGWFSILSV